MMGATEVRARVRLQVVDARSNVVDRIVLGERFELQLFVSDLRSAAQGVFSAYTDVAYQPSTGVQVVGLPVFVDPYLHGGEGYALLPGLLDDVGSFAGFLPLGAKERLQWRLGFRAAAPGPVRFEPLAAGGARGQVVVYGDNAAAVVEFVGTSIEVVSGALINLQAERAGGDVRLRVSGPPGGSVQVQASASVDHPAWEDLGGRLTLGPDGEAFVVDAGITGRLRRYYRVKAGN